MPYAPEPPYEHGSPPATAVLICNLGTPEAPTAAALRRYLAQFLSDPRVVEIPRIIWKPLLHGVILRTRPAKSAAKYATIWTDEGSPLKVWTERQAQGLDRALAAQGHHVLVRHAMRYGEPSIPTQLSALRAQGVKRVLVLPLYPQYSATTTASVFDEVFAWGQRTRHLPELRLVGRYHDHPAYIQALATRVREHWQAHGRPEKLVMSFHGVPKLTLTRGDPYHCECLKTGRLLAERLELGAQDYVVTFQSRFGKAEWLKPYTEPTLRELAREGIRHVDVICPGFVSDCIETLEEIAMEGKAVFMEHGGRIFHHIPCLNDLPQWIDALAGIAQEQLAGWPTREQPDPKALAAQRERALALGADR